MERKDYNIPHNKKWSEISNNRYVGHFWVWLIDTIEAAVSLLDEKFASCWNIGNFLTIPWFVSPLFFAKDTPILLPKWRNLFQVLRSSMDSGEDTRNYYWCKTLQVTLDFSSWSIRVEITRHRRHSGRRSRFRQKVIIRRSLVWQMISFDVQVA